MPPKKSLAMKILLVGPDYEENLSLRYLSGSLLSAGHHPVLAAFNSPIDTGAVANAAQDADLVGYPSVFKPEQGSSSLWRNKSRRAIPIS